MSIFFSIFQGKWDEILTWPFTHIVKFTILDQTDMKNHSSGISAKFVPKPNLVSGQFLEKPVNFRNPSIGIPRFASIGEIFGQKSRFLVNNTMYIRVEVEVTSDGYPGHIFNKGSRILEEAVFEKVDKAMQEIEDRESEKNSTTS